MTTTTGDTSELAAGVSRSEITRFVAETRPDLIKALERASEEYYRHEDTWQEEAERQQRDTGMPKQGLESPYGRALREAATAVTDAFDEMVASGQIEAKN